VHVPSTVRQINHQWPKVNQPLLESLLRTRPRLHPLELDSSPFGRFNDDFYTQTGKTAVGTNLDRGIVLKADAKRMLGQTWHGSSEVP
jgi:hypothetical protein